MGTHTGSFQRLLLQSNNLGSCTHTYSSQYACLYQGQTQPGASEQGAQFFWSSSLHPTTVSLNVELGCSTQPLIFFLLGLDVSARVCPTVHSVTRGQQLMVTSCLQQDLHLAALSSLASRTSDSIIGSTEQTRCCGRL